MQRNKQRQLPLRPLHRISHKRNLLEFPQLLMQLIRPLNKLYVNVLKLIIDHRQRLIKFSVPYLPRPVLPEQPIPNMIGFVRTIRGVLGDVVFFGVVAGVVEGES